jgi:L-asparaginase
VPAPEDLPEADEAWPWVEIVTSHGGARSDAVGLWCGAGVRGLVVAATGNGTVHSALDDARAAAAARGVPVLRATRCAAGGIVERQSSAAAAAAIEAARHLTPVQARVELMLRLLARPPERD